MEIIKDETTAWIDGQLSRRRFDPDTGPVVHYPEAFVHGGIRLRPWLVGLRLQELIDRVGEDAFQDALWHEYGLLPSEARYYMLRFVEHTAREEAERDRHMADLADPSRSLGFVYFIYGGGLVKIGYTKNDPRYRLKDLQAGSPILLSLLGYVEAPTWDERKLHRHFDALRVRGEWFRYADPLRFFIDTL